MATESIAITREPADCAECGETTREISLRDTLSDQAGVEPICYACIEADALPEGMPLGGRRVCRDCCRGERDGVNARIRRTWGIYPQDRYRIGGFPRFCDDCWEWRKELAPLKPSRDEIRNRWREVTIDGR